MVATVEAHAHDVYAALAEQTDADRDVAAIEPSDLVTFDREYGKLLPAKSHERLAADAYEGMEYVFGRLESGASDAGLVAASPSADDERVAYHSHCQQRTLGLEAPTVAVLDRLGYDVFTSDVECCGMAGSFGYEEEYYDLAMDVGGDLEAQLTAPETHDRTVVSSDTSCLEQRDSPLSRPSRRPI